MSGRGFSAGRLAPNRPIPIMAVNGKQGSAKSTLCRMMRVVLIPMSRRCVGLLKMNEIYDRRGQRLDRRF